MIHHRIYSYGQLFAFSGIDGDTAGARDFCATFLDGPVTLRFETKPPVTLRLPIGGGAAFDAIGGDFLEGRSANGGRLLVAFEGARSVVGLAPVEPMLDSAHPEDAPCRLAKEQSGGGWLFRLVLADSAAFRPPAEANDVPPSLAAVESAVRGATAQGRRQRRTCKRKGAPGR